MIVRGVANVGPAKLYHSRLSRCCRAAVDVEARLADQRIPRSRGTDPAIQRRPDASQTGLRSHPGTDEAFVVGLACCVFSAGVRPRVPS